MLGLTTPLWLSPILSALGKVPREVWYAIAAVIAWLIFSNHYDQQGYDRRTAEYVALMEQARQKAAVGDKKAAEASAQVIDAIEAENKRAVEAAAGSDDPLKSALDALGK